MANFLSGLPSFDQSAFSDYNARNKAHHATRPAVYTATSDRSLPPGDQVITTDKTHILLRYIKQNDTKVSANAGPSRERARPTQQPSNASETQPAANASAAMQTNSLPNSRHSSNPGSPQQPEPFQRASFSSMAAGFSSGSTAPNLFNARSGVAAAEPMDATSTAPLATSDSDKARVQRPPKRRASLPLNTDLKRTRVETDEADSNSSDD
ncbi:hypothetical protein CAOG_00495 [Capsaspora owczarzaki ATCC 30864]|uniref:DET1- and DDB1-associated protein 1 domain-containing protein n=1 Tax=Capsaspora owczarzaki (strain ATCC 30864) TaxID=595528 RepID=A0A0D2WH82_CAPO3|nr:hypothetical protein CAOG_00495 [Capsaspora owczarzaki ATCC 30864]KJE88925.1 hypothetical protein, variant [Capsaspora owczarzaki ATCC 30864]|eukprot:XP_004365366.2 hypothetical protein CAOG_00495 [Capsaspora owczarzaki ATCC 30864]